MKDTQESYKQKPDVTNVPPVTGTTPDPHQQVSNHQAILAKA